MTTTPPEPAPAPGPAAATPDAGDAALGDAGKRALDEERRARKDAETARKTAEEHAARVAHRLLHAELRAAAAGKLADPGDAARLLDLSRFTQAADGSYDTGAIGAAIDQLLTHKPYLAAGQRTPFQGGGDGGPRGEPGARQITREDLKGMSQAQIAAARREGRLDHLLRGQG
jgi:hypothetical protein